MKDDVRIRPMEPADVAGAVEVGRALPQWFTENGVHELTVDLPNHRGAVADRAGETVGFISWFAYLGIGHIGWMGVAPDHHRRGIGRRLLSALEEALRATGATVVRVDTLGDSVEYEPYERTRAFYRAAGFTDWKREITDNPEWPDKLTLEKRI